MQYINLDRETNDFQHLEVLKRNRNKRHRYGEIFVESVACINALLATGWELTSVAYHGERELSSWAKEVIATGNPQKVFRLTGPLMEKLSEREEPSELIVTAKMKRQGLEDIPLTDSTTLLIFDRPSNHGNLGSIMRSSDAFGVNGIITTGHSVDIYDPVVLRASLGAFFHLPVIHCPSIRELGQWLDRVRAEVPGFKVVGTSPSAHRMLHEIDLTGPVALVVGNEFSGVSRAITEMVDEMALIPMQGTVDSLNAACAGTVALYEMVRQRLTVHR